MEKPVISIITVCFNAADTIRQTVESVLSQTYPNVEYIVVDGGSKDGTVEIIRQYESMLAHFITEPDKGIYDAMNKGLKLASGEWVNFRNSGDVFVSDDVLDRFFAEPVDDAVGVVHGDCIYVNDWGWKRVRPSMEDGTYLNGMPVLHPASFIRTSIHKLRPFDLRYRMSGDYDFMYWCCENDVKFEYRPVPVAEFPVGGAATQNLMTTFRDDCMIRGEGRTLVSLLKVWCRAAVLRFKISALKVVSGSVWLSTVRRRGLEREGWKPLPYDKNMI